MKIFLKQPNSINIAQMGEGIVHYYWIVDDMDKIMQISILKNGWRIAIAVPKAELLSILNPLKSTSIIGTIILIIVICLIVYSVIGSLSKILIVT